MPQVKRKSILCPNCRKLISSDEQMCPYCNIVRPGSGLRNNIIVTGMSDARQLAVGIIWVNVIMYIVSLLLSGGGIGVNMNPFDMLAPSTESIVLLGASGTWPIDKVAMPFDVIPRWWTLLTANFLHGSLIHILFNLLMFWQLVPIVSKEYGSYRMLCIYLLGGAGGYLVSYFAGVPLTIGASSSVCALVGSLLYFGKSRGGAYGQLVYSQISGWVITLFIFGLLVSNINNWAHGGGIVSGLGLGWWLGYNDRNRELSFHKSLALVSVVLTGLALLWALGTGVIYRFM